MTTIDAPTGHVHSTDIGSTDFDSTDFDNTDPMQPRPVRDSLLPATVSLIAVLALLTGLAVAVGTVVRVVAGYVIG